MTDKEKILAEIERLKKWEPIAIPQEQRRKEIQCARMGVLIGLEDFINSLPTNQPSEDLKKAADCYLESIQPVGFMEGDYDGSQILDTFRAGANWQKERIINKAYEWILNNFKCSGYSMPLYYSGVTYSPKDIANDFKKAMEDK